MSWIKSSDRLPPEDEPVLIHDNQRGRMELGLYSKGLQKDAELLRAEIKGGGCLACAAATCIAAPGTENPHLSAEMNSCGLPS